jgi:hypothetical protein
MQRATWVYFLLKSCGCREPGAKKDLLAGPRSNDSRQYYKRENINTQFFNLTASAHVLFLTLVKENNSSHLKHSVKSDKPQFLGSSVCKVK